MVKMSRNVLREIVRRAMVKRAADFVREAVIAAHLTGDNDLTKDMLLSVVSACSEIMEIARCGTLVTNDEFVTALRIGIKNAKDKPTKPLTDEQSDDVFAHLKKELG